MLVHGVVYHTAFQSAIGRAVSLATFGKWLSHKASEIPWDDPWASGTIFKPVKPKSLQMSAGEELGQLD